MNETKVLTKVSTEKPSLSIVRRTIAVNQGDNTVYMTKNDVNAMRMLQEGKFDGNVYTSNVLPRTRYTLLKDGVILATCKDEGHDDIVTISPKVAKWITNFRDKYRPRLAFDKDFRSRY